MVWLRQQTTLCSKNSKIGSKMSGGLLVRVLFCDGSGKANLVADALSRKAELAAVSQPPTFRAGLGGDPQTKALLELIKQGKTKLFWWNRLFVPKTSERDNQGMPRLAGRVNRTMALVERGYYWPQMNGRKHLSYFSGGAPAGMLEPLPIPERPWCLDGLYHRRLASLHWGD